jgi:SAM-dependent methyltransferase
LVYEIKLTPFSSHVLLLSNLPERGEGKRVLDVGCGNGYLGKILADRGYLVTGIEQRGGTDRQFPPEVRLVEADLEHGIPALDGAFDYAICADVLEHLRDPLKVLKQVRAILAPGGLLIASLPNSGNLYFRLVVLSGRFPQYDKGLFDKTHVRFYTWNGWRQLLDEGGFAIQRVDETCIPFGLATKSRRMSLPIRLAEWVSYGMAKLWKRLFAYQFVVTARVR